MATTFATDPKLADARNALDVTGLPRPDVTVTDVTPNGLPPEVLGQYEPHSDEIWIAANGGPECTVTAVHEFAHVIWQRAGKSAALQHKINAVLHAIDGSPEVQYFSFERQLFGNARGDLDYILDANELWARAVAQYVFTSPRQASKYADMWHAVMADHDGGLQEMQWEAHDFPPIADAIEREFPPQH